MCVHTCQDNWFQGAPECLPLLSPVLKRAALFALGIVPQRKHLRSCTCDMLPETRRFTLDCIPSLSPCGLFHLQELNAPEHESNVLFGVTINFLYSPLCNYASAAKEVHFEMNLFFFLNPPPRSLLIWGGGVRVEGCCSPPCRSCHVLCSVPLLSFPCFGQGPASGQASDCATFHMRAAFFHSVPQLQTWNRRNRGEGRGI